MANIKLTKEQQQMIVLGIVMLGGFGYAYVTFFWMPTAKKIVETRTQIEGIEAKINKAKQVSARLPKLEQELLRLNEQAMAAERRLPKNKSVPDILVTIGGLAAKNGVELVSFTPGAIQSKPFFSELIYPLSIRGKYHNIGKFLAAVALEERIFNVQNVVYTEPGPDGTMSVTLTLVSYQYKG